MSPPESSPPRRRLTLSGVSSPPAANISVWTWGDYNWFVTGETAAPRGRGLDSRSSDQTFFVSLTRHVTWGPAAGADGTGGRTDKLGSFSHHLPEEALRLYPSSAPCPTRDRCPERSYTTMASDIRVTCPNNELALRAAGKRPPETRGETGGRWLSWSVCSGPGQPRLPLRGDPHALGPRQRHGRPAALPQPLLLPRPGRPVPLQRPGGRPGDAVPRRPGVPASHHAAPAHLFQNR